MKIHAFLRHTSHNANFKQRPNWFSYEVCFINFLETFDFENDTLTIVFDGTVENSIAEKYQSKFGYRIVPVNANSQIVSFYETCKVVMQSEDIAYDDLIYLVENDYMHKNGWQKIVKDLYATYEGISYATIYDHPDKYSHPIYEELVSKLYIVDNSSHWRSTPSTTGTFFVPYNIFQQDYDIHSSNESDHYKFIGPLNDRGRTILSCIPGYSTHCEHGVLSPMVQWEYIAQQYAK